MILRSAIMIGVAGLILSGCGTGGILAGQPQSEQAQKIASATAAVKVGRHEHAERLMADYVYRTEEGALKLRNVGFFGDDRKKAIDLIVLLLWETGRDKTLATFADDYLPSYERSVTHCRLAERQARYQDAFRCWNDLGHTDRAERVIRTDGAIRILRN